MSRTLTDNVNNGLLTIWYDEDRPFFSKPQILVTREDSKYMTNAIAVLISLSIPCAYVVLRRAFLLISSCLLWAARCIKGQFSVHYDVESQNDNQDVWLLTNLQTQLNNPGDEDNPLKAVRAVATRITGEGNISLDGRPGSVREALWTSLDNGKSTCIAMWNDWGLAIAAILVMIFFASILAGGTAVSVLSADIATDSVVSSSSPIAGDWQLESDSATFLLGGRAAIDENLRMRIWNYKEASYDTFEGDPACNILYTQKIPFETFAGSRCPFDGDACLLGPHSGFTATSHLQDSSVLGINVEPSKRPFFDVSLTCSPLQSDERYIKMTGSTEFPNEYKYYYGPFVIDSYLIQNETFTNSREWILGSDAENMQDYKVASNVYNPNHRLVNSFDPLPEFCAGNNTVTIVFITTGGEHYHIFERNDPIFPAKNRLDLNLGPAIETFWENNSTQAGVLGCVDTYTICTDSKKTKCWDGTNITNAFDDAADDKTRQRAIYLLAVGLRGTSVHSLINYNGAAVLNATAEMARFVGIRLAEEQWKVEVSNFFKALLAGLQIRIFDYARGTYAPSPRYPNMRDQTPAKLEASHGGSRAAVEVSKLFKFRSSEYENVSAVGFWGIIAACLALFLGTRRFSTDEKRRQALEIDGEGGFHNDLWFVIACKKIWSVSRSYSTRIWDSTRAVWNTTKMNWHQRSSKSSEEHPQGQSREHLVRTPVPDDRLTEDTAFAVDSSAGTVSEHSQFHSDVDNGTHSDSTSITAPSTDTPQPRQKPAASQQTQAPSIQSAVPPPVKYVQRTTNAGEENTAGRNNVPSDGPTATKPDAQLDSQPGQDAEHILQVTATNTSDPPRAS